MAGISRADRNLSSACIGQLKRHAARMKSSLFRRIANRVFHRMARTLPGSTSLRPGLHRLRGVHIGKDVFIGDEVYLENEYPEAVEIQDGVQISLRAVILAHTRGPGKVVIEQDAFIGPNAIIAASAGKTLRIGRGAVIGAAAVITRDVGAQVFVASPEARAVAKATVPMSRAASMHEFLRGLVPLRGAADDAVVADQGCRHRSGNEQQAGLTATGSGAFTRHD